MLLKMLREGLGRVLVFGDWVSRPKPIKRNEAQQQVANIDAQGLSLYQFYACPFCIKVRRKIHALNVPINVCDAQNDQRKRQELSIEGGKLKVPCLRIEEQGKVLWMYESSDIINYLNQRFGSV